MSGRIITGEEALDPSRSVDFVAPHSYSANMKIGESGPEAFLSVLSQMATDAAVSVTLTHPNSKLVVTGETCYGDEYPTTTELIIDRAINVLDQPDEDIVPLARPDGRGLDNTYLQTEALADFFNKDTAKTALIIPLGYHLKRIVHTARAYGIQADFVAAEDVLQAAGIDSYDEYLPLIAQLESSERVLRAVNRVDGQGKLLNFMMRSRGPRQVDVVEQDGELVLEQGYSRQKLERVLTLTK